MFDANKAVEVYSIAQLEKKKNHVQKIKNNLDQLKKDINTL